MGLFTSTLTHHQVIAAVTGFGLLLLFWFIDLAAGSVTGTLRQVLLALSAFTHFEPFTRGLISAADVTYFLSVIAGFLFLAERNLEREVVGMNDRGPTAGPPADSGSRRLGRRRRIRRGSESAVLTVAVLGILVLLNILAGRTGWQANISAEGTFYPLALSRQVLERLPAPVQVTAFVRDGPSGLLTDLLQQYDRASSSFQLRLVDPVKEPSRWPAEYEVTRV